MQTRVVVVGIHTYPMTSSYSASVPMIESNSLCKKQHIHPSFRNLAGEKKLIMLETGFLSWWGRKRIEQISVYLCGQDKAVGERG